MRQRPPATRTTVPGRPSMTSERVQAERKVVARLEIAEISRRRAARPPCYILIQEAQLATHVSFTAGMWSRPSGSC